MPQLPKKTGCQTQYLLIIATLFNICQTLKHWDDFDDTLCAYHKKMHHFPSIPCEGGAEIFRRISSAFMQSMQSFRALQNSLGGVVAASTWPKGTVRHTEAARASRREVSPPPSATAEHVLAWLGGRLFFSSGARLPMQYCDRTRPTPGAASPPPPFQAGRLWLGIEAGAKPPGGGPFQGTATVQAAPKALWGQRTTLTSPKHQWKVHFPLCALRVSKTFFPASTLFQPAHPRDLSEHPWSQVGGILFGSEEGEPFVLIFPVLGKIAYLRLIFPRV